MVDELVMLKMLLGYNEWFVRAGMVSTIYVGIYPKLDSGAIGRIFLLRPIK
jgi:hypothetical protein